MSAKFSPKAFNLGNASWHTEQVRLYRRANSGIDRAAEGARSGAALTRKSKAYRESFDAIDKPPVARQRSERYGSRSTGRCSCTFRPVNIAEITVPPSRNSATTAAAI